MATGKWNSKVTGLAAGAIALVIAGAAIYPSVSWAADSSTPVAQDATATPAPKAPGSEKGNNGPWYNGDEALAKALGISVEDLQAAQTKAAQAALDKAVADGDITQKQADAMKERMGGSAPMGMMGHFFGMGGSETDRDSLLADALGISTDDLV